MNTTIRLAVDEWRYWWRTQVLVLAGGAFGVLLLATFFATAWSQSEAAHHRENSQLEAEETWRAQPDRHPHRMVHYGHYAFRAPSPLSIFDPGIDAVTGQTIFLEGHRQNSATFADAVASANLGGFAWLTPARVYQLFGALLMVLVGHSAVVREREAATLPTMMMHGVSGATLLVGKFAALASLAVLLVLPLFAVSALVQGVRDAVMLSAAYVIYLCIWGALALCLSVTLASRRVALAMATTLWLGLSLLIPSVSVDAVARGQDALGKIELDLAMQSDIRAAGDGHNANDPAFAALRQSLLEKYEVTDVADLPVNFRGVVATASEEKLTKLLNQYADERMQREMAQDAALRRYGWLSPMLTIGAASRAISGTDLANYHRFLRETEALRYEFVQGLNNLHANELSYQLDINRNIDTASSKRARLSADNWALLEAFRFEPQSLNERAANATPALITLFAWLTLSLGAALFLSRRLTP